MHIQYNTSLEMFILDSDRPGLEAAAKTADFSQQKLIARALLREGENVINTLCLPELSPMNNPSRADPSRSRGLGSRPGQLTDGCPVGLQDELQHFS